MRALTVLPDATEVESVEDNDVLASLHRHGTILTSPCGGEGTCGKCRIQVEDGAVNAPTPQERSLLGAALDDGWRLACQTTLQADATVRIPPSSRVPNVRVLTGGISPTCRSSPTSDAGRSRGNVPRSVMPSPLSMLSPTCWMPEPTSASSLK